MKTHSGILILAILSFAISNAYPQIDDFQNLFRFQHQDSSKTSYCQPQALYINNEVFIFYSVNKTPVDTIYLRKSNDNGQSWTAPISVTIVNRENEEVIFLSSLASNTGRILLVYSVGLSTSNNPTKIIYSDNNGQTWSTPQNVIGTAYIPYPKLSSTLDGKLWITGRNNNFFYSTNNGNTWTAKNIGFFTTAFTSFDLLSLDSTNFVTTYDRYDSNTDKYKIYYRKSTNAGDNWSDEILITEINHSETKPRLFLESDGTLLLVHQRSDSTSFTINHNIYQENIFYRKSFNNGNTWSVSERFTNYLGYDGTFNICEYPNKPLITFLSDRWYGKNQIWIGQIEVSQDNQTPPVLFRTENSALYPAMPLNIRAYVGSTLGIQKVELKYELNNTTYGPLLMYDDGNHGDSTAGDNIWGIDIGPFNYFDIVKTSIIVTDINSVSVIYTGNTLQFPHPPIENKWMSVGSLHNWYSSVGSEMEEGFVMRQQFGMQWPGIYRYQDLQASRGIWFGCTNFTDENGIFYSHKVVTVGPRTPQIFGVYPLEFKMISKYDPTLVKVNGQPSYDKEVSIDSIDNSMKWDRMIINRLNTQLGISMERKVFQFSQSFNDSYIVYEYIFTNTGNVNGNPEIELPNNTVENFYVLWNFRNAINQSTRYVIGNETGWGKNTMNDARGDGVVPDPPGENFRAQFSWHGYFPQKSVAYDNIGAPIWSLNSSALLYNDPADTIGRLGGTQFAGIVTLHADMSANNSSDDPSQPSTTAWADSDNPILMALSNPFNVPRMTMEYEYMSSGHHSPRHAFAVQPDGNFALQRSNPSIYSPGSGGTTFSTGFGPYTLAPGENIRIVIAEAVGGLSRERQVSVGQLYKAGAISDEAKDSIVIFEGRDSLFSTFRNAIENFSSGWNISLPPDPPITFNVNSDSHKVYLSWTINESSPPESFRVYRTSEKFYNDYTMIAELPSNVRAFTDTNLYAYTDYYYFLTCVGSEQPGGPATPPGRLESSRYYTQTYDPVYVFYTTGINNPPLHLYTFELLQNYPNPFNPSTLIRYQLASAGDVTLKVYDVLGREVAALVDEFKVAGYHEVEFQPASSIQQPASGIYFYQLRAGEYTKTKKMLLLR